MRIPLVKLRAALIGARLLKSVSTVLKVSATNCYAWSDSQVALHWIKFNEPSENNLVDDYVAHIREFTQPDAMALCSCK